MYISHKKRACKEALFLLNIQYLDLLFVAALVATAAALIAAGRSVAVACASTAVTAICRAITFAVFTAFVYNRRVWFTYANAVAAPIFLANTIACTDFTIEVTLAFTNIWLIRVWESIAGIYIMQIPVTSLSMIAKNC